MIGVILGLVWLMVPTLEDRRKRISKVNKDLELTTARKVALLYGKGKR